MKAADRPGNLAEIPVLCLFERWLRSATAMCGGRAGERTGILARPTADHAAQTITTTMCETPPDRLALDPRSPFHDAALLDRGIGVRFNGQERDNVEEYSVSEGWIRVQVGRSRDRRGNPMTMKVKGTVEPYFLDQA